jgi:hypothetical protein
VSEPIVPKVIIERERGCGYRKPGGYYLMAEGTLAPCGKLPIVLDVCPCCGAGIKPTRGWTWVDGDALLGPKECSLPKAPKACKACPLGGKLGRCGLLWIGGSHYETPGHFLREAAAPGFDGLPMGVSRRIKAIPKDFKVGETLVLVAHRKAILLPDGETYQAAVFHSFRPTRIERVVTDETTQEELERLVERGVTPVKVIPEKDYSPLFKEVIK